MMVLIILAVIATLLFFVWLCSYPFYWHWRGVPCQTPLPIFGAMLPAVYQSLILFWLKAYEKWKRHPIYGFHLFITPSLFISDPEIIKKVCVVDSDYFMSHGFPLNQDRDVFGRSLFLLEGEQWRVVRSKMSPYFSSNRVKAMTPLLKGHTEHFIDRMREMSKMGPVEVQLDLSMRFSTDVLLSNSFGIISNSFQEEDPFFFSVQKELMGIATSVKVLVNMFSSKLYDALSLTFVSKNILHQLEAFIRDMVELRKRGIGVQPDLFQGLVELLKKEEMSQDKNTHYKDGTRIARFDLQGVTAQSLILYMAGTETTGSTLGFLLHELAYNQAIQDKVREEILSVKEDLSEALTYDEIQHLSYTHMVINETLRKYPILPNLMRKCTKDYTCGDLKIEKGTFIMVSIFGLHWDPEYFPEPEKFIPERFASDGHIKSGTYLPFGAGPRTCIGMKFSLHEIAFALTKIITSFRLHPSTKNGYNVELKLNNPTLISKKGIWLEVEPL